VRHADPTDAGGLVRKIAAYKPTLLVGTPTFLSFMLDRAKPGDLDSLRFIIVGAEKCPDSLFKYCAELAPQAALLEGYGITECSPMVSGNAAGATKPGTVGKPLPGVELLVLDVDTEKPVGKNQLGTLLVSGTDDFSRLYRLRRAVAVPGDRRQALVCNGRPGEDRRRGLH
jgi:long-chain-fatty-acid--[acyl-carrier-protein] ligase